MLRVACVRLIFLVSFLMTQIALGEGARSKENNDTVNGDNFRCEQFPADGLSELKERLLSKCNLEKPFSSSYTKFLDGNYYMFCCHKKN